MFQRPSIVPGMPILKISRSSPANVPSAVRKKRYFRMNLIGLTPAVDAGSPLTLRNARLKARAKVSRRASVLAYMLLGNESFPAARAKPSFEILRFAVPSARNFIRATPLAASVQSNRERNSEKENIEYRIMNIECRSKVFCLVYKK